MLFTRQASGSIRPAVHPAVQIDKSILQPGLILLLDGQQRVVDRGRQITLIPALSRSSLSRLISKRTLNTLNPGFLRIATSDVPFEALRPNALS